MAEETKVLEDVSAKRYLMRSHDLFDREWSHQVSTSQRYTETTSINCTEQQRAIVENTPREAKSDVSVLTESVRQNNLNDSASIIALLGTIFGDNGMKYRYAAGNPPVGA